MRGAQSGCPDGGAADVSRLKKMAVMGMIMVLVVVTVLTRAMMLGVVMMLVVVMLVFN